MIKENIRDGQSVEQFFIQLLTPKTLESFMGSTIGNKRIFTFPIANADDIFVYFIDSKGKVEIAEIEAYLIDESLVEK